MTTTETSAALLIWRRRGEALEILLAHPGGPYWRNRDVGAWSLPKGLVEPGEDVRTAAAREFAEEVGLPAPSPGEALTPRRLKSGKLVAAWMAEADLDLSGAGSGLFEMEWPPRSGRKAWFPEVDRVAYWPLRTALIKVNAGQRPILEEAEARLAAG